MYSWLQNIDAYGLIKIEYDMFRYNLSFHVYL